jgi:hypothetical protein
MKLQNVCYFLTLKRQILKLCLTMKLLNTVYEYAFDASVFTFTHPLNVYE